MGQVSGDIVRQGSKAAAQRPAKLARVRTMGRRTGIGKPATLWREKLRNGAMLGRGGLIAFRQPSSLPSTSTTAARSLGRGVDAGIFARCLPVAQRQAAVGVGGPGVHAGCRRQAMVLSLKLKKRLAFAGAGSHRYFTRPVSRTGEARVDHSGCFRYGRRRFQMGVE